MFGDSCDCKRKQTECSDDQYCPAVPSHVPFEPRWNPKSVGGDPNRDGKNYQYLSERPGYDTKRTM